MKRPLFVLFGLLAGYVFSQQGFSGGYYAVWQYYVPDSVTHFSPPEGRWRGMNYFNLNFRKGAWETGIQLESYLPQSLLGYDPALQGNIVTGYYARYRKKQWDVTGGFLYDQFGSGLVFRTWEDRQLGINNALLGVRVKYAMPGLNITFLSGNPRTAVTLSEATLTGIDLQADMQEWCKKLPAWQVGFSVVSKYETPQTPQVPATVDLFSARTSLTAGAFDFNFEYAYKSPDALYNNGVIDDLVLFDGDAYLFNLGYAVKGFGTNLTLRRAENMRLYAQRDLSGNPYNTGLMNYIPALTKQHDYLLTNLFVYSAQDQISFAEQTAGEIGGQWDMFLFLKRKSFLGGKYGTRIAFNWSRWHGLKTEFVPALHTYRREMWTPGKLYYQDINLEIKRKLSRRIKTGFLIMKQDYDRLKLEGHGEMLHNLIVVSDWQVKLKKHSSVRIAGEHLWNNEDEGNWAAAALEYSHRGKWNFFLTDRYHYGTTGIHYYSAGMSYNYKGNRLSLAYGRERGGLVCVGGVCRYVPPNTGLQMTLNLNF